MCTARKRPDFEAVKVETMYLLMKTKYEQHPEGLSLNR
jgi:hypothetical protein